MSSIANIGQTIHIKGSVTADEPFTVAGFVEGTISVNGHPLTIAPGGTLKAEAVAETILVEGTVTGSLIAESRLMLRNTAHVTGEIHAPLLAVAEGATLQGKVDTGTRKKAASAA